MIEFVSNICYINIVLVIFERVYVQFDYYRRFFIPDLMTQYTFSIVKRFGTGNGIIKNSRARFYDRFMACFFSLNNYSLKRNGNAIIEGLK